MEDNKFLKWKKRGKH